MFNKINQVIKVFDKLENILSQAHKIKMQDVSKYHTNTVEPLRKELLDLMTYMPNAVELQRLSSYINESIDKAGIVQSIAWQNPNAVPPEIIEQTNKNMSVLIPLQSKIQKLADLAGIDELTNNENI